MTTQHGSNTTWQQHGSNTTWQQHGSITTRWQHKIWYKHYWAETTAQRGKKVETTIPHTKQPQLSVRVSMNESLNEETEMKLSSWSVCCSSFQSLATANWKDERPREVCALGTFNRMWLAERVFMWRMRAAVDFSDSGAWGLRGFYK